MFWVAKSQDMQYLILALIYKQLLIETLLLVKLDALERGIGYLSPVEKVEFLWYSLVYFELWTMWLFVFYLVETER